MSKLSNFIKRARRLDPGGRPSVMVALACHRTPNPRTMMALRRMMTQFVQLGTGHDLVDFVQQSSSIIAARNRAAAYCLELERCKGVLFVDDDMHFPTPGDGFNVLLRLMSLDKDVVGGLCTTRSMPISFTCGWENEAGTMRNLQDPAIAGAEAADPFQIDFIGFGVTFVSRDCLLRVVEQTKDPGKVFNTEHCWRFLPDLDARLARHAGDLEGLKDEIDLLVRESEQLTEDLSFCKKARAAGCTIWCDPSFEIQHIGDYGYSRMDWLAQHEERKRMALEAAAKKAAG